MPATPSRRSDGSGVPASGTRTISNQILYILCIDVELPRWLFKAGTREDAAFLARPRRPVVRYCP